MPLDPKISLQKQFAPNSVCFGCGPANMQGLQLESFVGADSIGNPTNGNQDSLGILFANFQPKPYHIAFDGIVNGGIISALLDCHLNWTGAWQLMLAGDLDSPPCCVTAKYEVTFKAPTPIGAKLKLEAWIEEIRGRKAVVRGNLGPVLPDSSNSNPIPTITATAHGTFVAVKPDHPAFHRW